MVEATTTMPMTALTNLVWDHPPNIYL